MNKKQAAITAGAFSAGTVIGMYAQTRFMRSKLNKILPVCMSSVVSVVEKLHDESVSRREIIDHIQTEMDFFGMAVHNATTKA